MTNEDLNKAAFGIQALAEKAGMVGFVCAFVHRDEANPGNIVAGGFSTLPNLSGDTDAVKNGLRAITEGLTNTAKENVWKAYDNRIEAMAVERAREQAKEIAEASPADPSQPDPALG